MSYKEELELILDQIERHRTFCCRELKHLPVGELRVEKSGKYKQLRRYYYRNGKMLRESVSKNPELIQQLKRRAYYENELKILEKDTQVINAAFASVEGNDFNTVRQKLGINSRDLSFEDTMYYADSGLLIPHPVQNCDVPIRELELNLGDIDLFEWAVMPYRENTGYMENKCHVGRTGMRYRSRAEMTVFEHIIITRKQPVHYDELIEINGEVFSPDGILPSVTGAINLIEYMELNSADYMRSNTRKLEYYHKKGFVPGRNLIILTCETNGAINIPKIDKILDAHLLV